MYNCYVYQTYLFCGNTVSISTTITSKYTLVKIEGSEKSIGSKGLALNVANPIII